ncbi:hypothetical protein HMPREF3207_01911 [Citrobacter koseri]|nr:hypothetical protein HMPREF3207_01911 [Citrobacter koseri]
MALRLSGLQTVLYHRPDKASLPDGATLIRPTDGAISQAG